MSATSLFKWAAPVALAASMSAAPLAQAGQSLGSVRIPRNVVADGQPLPAGTYTVRLVNQSVAPAVGLSPEGSQWVEFVQGGQARGKELATVLAPPEVKAVAETAPPAAGAAKVQMLKGADYIRVWLNRAGTQYLIHFNLAGK